MLGTDSDAQEDWFPCCFALCDKIVGDYRRTAKELVAARLVVHSCACHDPNETLRIPESHDEIDRLVPCWETDCTLKAEPRVTRCIHR